MAGSVNKVILIGHLGKDPEIRTFQNGGRVANMRIATSETWRDKASGERRERTEWHTVAITNEHLVGVAERFLRKGSKVYVEGQLATRKYEKDGREHYTTEVVIRPFGGDLTLLDKQETGRAGSPEDYDRHDPPRDSSPRPAGAAAPSPSQDFDDEIPF